MKKLQYFLLLILFLKSFSSFSQSLTKEVIINSSHTNKLISSLYYPDLNKLALSIYKTDQYSFDSASNIANNYNFCTLYLYDIKTGTKKDFEFRGNADSIYINLTDYPLWDAQENLMILETYHERSSLNYTSYARSKLYNELLFLDTNLTTQRILKLDNQNGTLYFPATNMELIGNYIYLIAYDGNGKHYLCRVDKFTGAFLKKIELQRKPLIQNNTVILNMSLLNDSTIITWGEYINRVNITQDTVEASYPSTPLTHNDFVYIPFFTHILDGDTSVNYAGNRVTGEVKVIRENLYTGVMKTITNIKITIPPPFNGESCGVDYSANDLLNPDYQYVASNNKNKMGIYSFDATGAVRWYRYFVEDSLRINSVNVMSTKDSGVIIFFNMGMDSLYTTPNSLYVIRLDKNGVQDTDFLLSRDNPDYFKIEKGLLVFPNPAKDDKIMLSGLGNDKYFYQISTMDGRLIKKDILSASHTIDIELLPAASYLLRIYTDNSGYSPTIFRKE